MTAVPSMGASPRPDILRLTHEYRSATWLCWSVTIPVSFGKIVIELFIASFLGWRFMLRIILLKLLLSYGIHKLV